MKSKSRLLVESVIAQARLKPLQEDHMGGKLHIVAYGDSDEPSGGFKEALLESLTSLGLWAVEGIYAPMDAGFIAIAPKMPTAQELAGEIAETFGDEAEEVLPYAQTVVGGKKAVKPHSFELTLEKPIKGFERPTRPQVRRR